MASSTTPHATRLQLLRGVMKRHKITAYLVPRQDEFQGEYVAPYAERLKWLTGFAGSWGVALITLKEAAIFVDGRYTIQVGEQTETKLFKPHHLIDHPPASWIGKNLRKGDRLGFDPWLTTIADAAKLRLACDEIGARLLPVNDNLIDMVWADQPKRPTALVKVQPQQFAGRSVADKLADMSAELAKAGADALVLSDTSSVSWLFNIRGDDIPFTPVVAAYAIVRRKGKSEIFIDPAKVPEDVRDHLAKHASVSKREKMAVAVSSLGSKKKVMIDHAATPEQVRLALAKSKTTIIPAPDPCTLPKAQKNTTEQQGARAAHLRDGAAMVKYLHWLENEAPLGTLDEWTAAQRLKAFRAESEVFLDLSFSVISAVAGNAAIPHYSVTPESARPLLMNQIYLIDSGGQYQDGTTDVTRTTIIGQPTDEMKDRFTRVLKGMIQLSVLRFPKSTTGAQIDALARAALWKAGLDYDHGTGHGVGSYLSVHEGPARISKSSHVALQPGMIMSNEPGFYKAGQFGIRIENLLLVKKPEAIKGGNRDMMGFETLTLCPIERRLIEQRLLTREELDWLDAYHANVWRSLRPMVDGPTAKWLTKACGPIR